MSTTALTSRQANPVLALPGAMDAIHGLSKAVSRTRVPINLELVHLRASQINGCSVCVDMHAKAARKAGETEERLFAVAAWRDTPFFTDAERAALALTEALTRLADGADVVPDELWAEVCEHFDEPQRAALVVEIAHINLWNRVNVATRQVVGEQGW
jgi:AhpD family alkylhydroperoxidase